MGKYRLLYVIDSLQIGGAEKSTLELAMRLEDFDVIVCTLFSSNADLAIDFERVNIPVESLHLTSRNWWMKGPSQLLGFVRKNNIDLVHASLFKSEIVTRIALRNDKIPNIGSFVNDSYAPERFSKLSTSQALKLQVVRRIDRFTAGWATHFTSITKHIAATNAKSLAIPASKITVIYRGRNSEGFTAYQPEYIPHDEFIFIMVARLLERKGYMDMIQAAAILKQAGYNFNVLAAGDGHDRKRIESFAREKNVNDIVRFLGKRNDIPEIMKSAHAFLFPSHYEGQGGALVEAMFSAKPIIATNIPVISEQVKHNESALLFKLFSAEDMADKMRWVMDNYADAKTLGIEARKIAMKNFEIGEIAIHLNSFYLAFLQ